MSTRITSQVGASGRERVAIYVDGLNLYHGIRSRSWMRFQWLDVGALGTRLLRNRQELVTVKYFVARFLQGGADDGMVDRQDAYLQALGLDDRTQIIEGEFQSKSTRCPKCRLERPLFEEKQTDVNIAVELICDAEDDVFDVAIVVSGDADLSGPLKRVQERHLGKSLVVAFPPNRRSTVLEHVASGDISISAEMLRSSQLPDTLYTPSGYLLRRPDAWH